MSLVQLCSFSKDVYKVFFFSSSGHSKTILLSPQVCLFFWVLFSTGALFHSYFLRSCYIFFFGWPSLGCLSLCALVMVVQFLFFTCTHTHNLRNCCIGYENLSKCLYHLARPQWCTFACGLAPGWHFCIVSALAKQRSI